MSVLSIKVPIRKKSGNLSYALVYSHKHLLHSLDIQLESDKSKLQNFMQKDLLSCNANICKIFTLWLISSFLTRKIFTTSILIKLFTQVKEKISVCRLLLYSIVHITYPSHTHTHTHTHTHVYIYIYHHHHHIVLAARISLTLSRHSSLSFIALGRSSGQQPVSSHSCWMYVRAGRPAFARPCVGIHKSTSLMSSSLLLQQCPACLVRLTWIVCVW